LVLPLQRLALLLLRLATKGGTQLLENATSRIQRVDGSPPALKAGIAKEAPFGEETFFI